MYRITCPSCFSKIKINDDLLGKKVGCKCGSVLRLPQAPGEITDADVIKFSCSGCKKKLQVNRESAGKTAKCSCGATSQVPIPVQLEEETFVATEVEEFEDLTDWAAADPSYDVSTDDPFASAQSFGASTPSHWSAPAPGNPYATPASTGAKGGRVSTLKTQLLIASIILLVQAAMYLLLMLISLPQQIILIQATDTTTAEGQGRVAGQVFAMVLIALSSTFTIWGSICMIRIKNWGVALAAAILSVIPCLSPCYIGGIPFGIWALILLSQSELKRKFK